MFELDREEKDFDLINDELILNEPRDDDDGIKEGSDIISQDVSTTQAYMFF